MFFARQREKFFGPFLEPLFAHDDSYPNKNLPPSFFRIFPGSRPKKTTPRGTQIKTPGVFIRNCRDGYHSSICVGTGLLTELQATCIYLSLLRKLVRASLEPSQQPPRPQQAKQASWCQRAVHPPIGTVTGLAHPLTLTSSAHPELRAGKVQAPSQIPKSQCESHCVRWIVSIPIKYRNCSFSRT